MALRSPSSLRLIAARLGGAHGAAHAAATSTSSSTAALLEGGGLALHHHGRSRLNLLGRRGFAAAEQHRAAESMPLSTGRPRLLVCGTGWAAARLVHDIDPKLYDITV